MGAFHAVLECAAGREFRTHMGRDIVEAGEGAAGPARSCLLHRETPRRLAGAGRRPGRFPRAGSAPGSSGRAAPSFGFGLRCCVPPRVPPVRPGCLPASPVHGLFTAMYSTPPSEKRERNREHRYLMQFRFVAMKGAAHGAGCRRAWLLL